MLKWDRQAALFSVNSFAAAMLALAIGFSLDLQRPYWAVMTVYIISQPLSGAVRSKALYRVIGTLGGAAFALWIVPQLVDQPLLLSFALALWVGVCLGVSLLDRTPRAYMLMLAGYTATLIAFPVTDHPEIVWDVAVSRVEEIILGILCATLFHSMVFPRAVGFTLRQRLTLWVGEADEWALSLLRGGDPDMAENDRRGLAAAVTDIRVLSTHLPFDTSHLRQTTNLVRAMARRLCFLIPVLSGLGDRLTALRAVPQGFDPQIDALIAETEAWVAAGAKPEAGAVLARRLAEYRAAVRSDDWPTLLRESLVARLEDLQVNLGEAHDLLAAIQEKPVPLPPALADKVAHQARQPLHRDVGLAAISGLSAALSIMLVCGVWIVTGWAEGSAAAALAGVFCALFAATDDPAPAIKAFGIFYGVALVLAGIYQFAILPAIDGFPLLVTVLAPALLAAGYYMVTPRTALPALAFAIGFSSSLALQETFSFDFAAFWNGNLAIYVGLFVALLVTRTMRSLSVERAAQRLLRRTWHSMANVARHHGQQDLAVISGEMVDRLGLLTPKLAASGPAFGVNAASLLTDLRIAMNLALLQRHRASFAPAPRAALAALLTKIGHYFTDRSAGRAHAPAPDLLTALDACLRLAACAPQRDGVTALVGLRRNLFPQAASFNPSPHAEPE